MELIEPVKKKKDTEMDALAKSEKARKRKLLAIKQAEAEKVCVCVFRSFGQLLCTPVCVVVRVKAASCEGQAGEGKRLLDLVNEASIALDARRSPWYPELCCALDDRTALAAPCQCHYS